MIGHQTIAFDYHTKSGGLLFKNTQILATIIIHKEYILLVVTPLGNMVRDIRHYYSGCPGHDDKYNGKKRSVKSKISTLPEQFKSPKGVQCTGVGEGVGVKALEQVSVHFISSIFG